eukprot:scaffold139642_cov36-Cyclotella_meneghiniana.AAC.2
MDCATLVCGEGVVAELALGLCGVSEMAEGHFSRFAKKKAWRGCRKGLTKLSTAYAVAHTTGIICSQLP